MIIAITGPTAVGKTKLSLALAQKYNAEIINYDSVQVYKYLDIGSAKISPKETNGIKHHLIDIVDPSQKFTVYDYQKVGRSIIENLQKQNKNIILVGGTGLYLKALLYDYQFNKETNQNNYQNLSREELYELLLQKDPNIKIDKNNPRRLKRALEYYDNIGKSINENNNGDKLLYNTIFIGLTTNRDNLYQRINSRVENMFVQGLENEAKKLFNQNQNITAIGYKELFSYFKGEIPKEEAIELIKRNSRRYAKRQYTFFKNKLNIKWFETNYENFNETINDIVEYIKKKCYDY